MMEDLNCLKGELIVQISSYSYGQNKENKTVPSQVSWASQQGMSDGLLPVFCNALAES